MRKITYIVLLLLFSTALNAQSWRKLSTGFKKAYAVNGINSYKNKLYAYGALDTVGGVSYTMVARWDSGHWRVIIGNNYHYYPFEGCINSFNNELYIGGNFSCTGIDTCYKHIARWNGSNWNDVGGGDAHLTSRIYALCVYNSSLYMGGAGTTQLGTASVHNIGRWDGSQWHDVAGGITSGYEEVDCMTTFKNELYVAGDFGYAGSTKANNIAHWNGNRWDSLAKGTNGTVWAMATDTANNLLYVGGSFGLAGSDTLVSPGMAVWDGQQWYKMPVAPDIGGHITSMVFYHGLLYMGRISTYAAGFTAISSWNGQNWTDLGPLYGNINTMYIFNDTLYAGGTFHKIAGQTDTTFNNIVAYYAPAPIISLSTLVSQATACNGATAIAVISGGKAPFHYNWSNGSTTPQIVAATGTYTVTVTDNAAHKATASASITASPPFKATIAATISTGSNGSASVMASGGTLPYIYTWSNGKTTAGISGLISGTYFVTVSDKNHCQLKDTAVVKSNVGIAGLLNNQQQINIWPNPVTTSVLNIEYSGIIERIEVYNILGQSVLQSRATHALDVSGLAKGVYTIILSDKQNRAIRKIVIQ